MMRKLQDSDRSETKGADAVEANGTTLSAREPCKPVSEAIMVANASRKGAELAFQILSDVNLALAYERQ